MERGKVERRSAQDKLKENMREAIQEERGGEVTGKRRISKLGRQGMGRKGEIKAGER